MDNVMHTPSRSPEGRLLAPGEAMEVLCGSPLFSGIPSGIRSRIGSTATIRTVPRFENLFVQGEEITSLILLELGSAKHTRVGANGHEVMLRICGPGDVLAGQGFSGESRHRYSCRAIEQSTVLTWEKDRFRKFMQLHPQLADNLSQILSAKLSELEVKHHEFATEEATTRVALLLVMLCKKMGTSADEGIRLALSRDEIAQMAGISTFTICRMLSRWSERGLVLKRREAVIVPDLQRLKHPFETKIPYRELH